MSKLLAFGAATALALAAAGAAEAQQASCSALVTSGACVCAAPIPPGGIIGQLQGVSGNVVIAGATNFTPASTSTNLHVGDGVTVGPNSSAAATLGLECQTHSLPSPGQASISQVGQCGCLNVRTTPQPTGVHNRTILIGAGIAAFLLHELNKPVSP